MSRTLQYRGRLRSVHGRSRELVTKRRTYLISNPYDLDAVEFINTMFMYFGLRPVCLYTDRKARHYGERQFPVLRSDLIEGRLDIDGRSVTDIAAELQRKYDVVAVIPYREDAVELAADLVDALGLDWNDGETLRVFRNKFDLKKRLAERDATVRVPVNRLVASVDDVWAEQPPDRFVLKPNDGLGNQNIGIFTADERDAIAAHINASPNTLWILEEYIGGTEYHVNGQIRSDGEVAILSMVEYERIEVNGYPTVYSAEVQCPTDHKHFAIATEYARNLLRATGLRRCPFHMELKVDEHGACVIDLGARFASDGGPRIFSRLHPDRPDMFAVAAHDYVGENQFACDPVDFTYYNSTMMVIVHGISEDAHTISAVSGLGAVEALPEFVRWIRKPMAGERASITTDLHSSPYVVELQVDRRRQHEIQQLIEQVRATIEIHSGQSLQGIRATADSTISRAANLASWLRQSVTDRLLVSN